ncbi:MAG: stalk domain-containing protein [Candidatus Saccharibacteria bacterium]
MNRKKTYPIKALILALAFMLLAAQPAIAVQFVIPGGSIQPNLAIIPPTPTDLKARGNLDVNSGIYIKVSWTNPSDANACFSIERKTGSGPYSEIGTTSNGVHEFKDTNSLNGNTTYTYRVRTVVPGSTPIYSAYSNEATVTILGTPSNVTASIDNSGFLNVNWQYSYNTLGVGFIVLLSNGQDCEPINPKPCYTNYFKYDLHSAQPGITFKVGVVAMDTNHNISPPSNFVTVTMPDLQQQSQQNQQQQDPQQSQQTQTQQDQSQMPGSNSGDSSKIVIQLFLGKKAYDVNGNVEQMDAAPISKWGRTLLPVKYIADALGADVQWNPAEKKATIGLNGKTIEVWVGKNIARINGNTVVIDPQNPQVKGITVPPGRTLLPLRFIAENLGCDVQWDPNLQRATVTYPK